MKTNNSIKPSPRFAASGWADNSGNLWLFGGKNILKTNESERIQMLNDTWKFNPKTMRWYHVLSTNTSKLPHNLDGLMSCFCAGLGFSFGTRFHENKSFHELWTYNISSNLWNLKELPKEIKSGYDHCFALSCNNNLWATSLLCSNSTSLQMWTFTVRMDMWVSKSIPSTEIFRNLILKNVSKSNMNLIWTSSLEDTVYVYHWSLGKPNNSVLLTITHTNTTITHISSHGPACRIGSITWIDSTSNLYVLGGKKCDSTQLYSDHWMFNVKDYNWISLNINKPNPKQRSYACSWQVGSSLWVYGGQFQNNKGVTKVLSDIWLGKPSKHVVPVPVIPNHQLPGDTLGLSMVDKLIISGVVLLVVMAVMVRLCYKRELNQMLMQLRRRRVPYHQLSQEGDKGSRL